MIKNQYDAVIIGSGMGSLTTPCLLAKAGQKVAVLEQNYLAGGCTSSYWRKGFVFESGATTLVGLDENMSLKYLLDELGITLNPMLLELPMQVHFSDKKILNRYQNLDAWIAEAQRHFGTKNQRAFWQFCYQISQFVWKTSLRQKYFPPSNFQDIWQTLKNTNWTQVRHARYAFISMRNLLQKFDLLDNTKFVQFVDEQLLITAQNTHSEVNVLFGATALCYTNYGNYYVAGGLINLVNPLIEFLEQNQGKLFLRYPVYKITKKDANYLITCRLRGDKEINFMSKYLISGIPLNNLTEIFERDKFQKKYTQKLLPSEKLNGAFQMGIGFVPHRKTTCIHHQIHLEKPLSQIHSNSIFLSLNHPKDSTRCDEEHHAVASISTHVSHPDKNAFLDKNKLETEILEVLEKHDLIRQNHVIYQHSSAPKAWEKWTLRKFGAVGGYPQYFGIKPWEMPDARAGNGLYLCGDTVYPGQGIAGVTLGGIIAFEKWKKDHAPELES